MRRRDKATKGAVLRQPIRARIPGGGVAGRSLSRLVLRRCQSARCRRRERSAVGDCADTAAAQTTYWNRIGFSRTGFIVFNTMGNGLSEQTPILSGISAFQALHIVILGLDCAGKTTVLYRLQFNEFVNTVPTKGFNTEKIKVPLGNSKSVTIHFWDVGGQEKLRPLWKSYTRCTDGIVFVVDSVDAERMEEAKTELYKITKISENQGVPFSLWPTSRTSGTHYLWQKSRSCWH
ncbi:unnamed protein product [Ranitomeya imitator]|uniref:ADP-ribosylation factor 4 n=1 Tax=Ranitomeya imitator TaxID=111125 RepID=A0ABN9MN89_9NEOB|nr:unnamed protein product [Ranitomeya imitator]